VTSPENRPEPPTPAAPPAPVAPVAPVASSPPAAAPSPPPSPSKVGGVPFAAAVGTALALVERDLWVLYKDGFAFVLRTSMQPALFAFVFAFVFPRIGQGIGGRGAVAYASMLLPGLMGNTLMFQGFTAVALPLVTEFYGTKEIEDRVMSPVPVAIVGLCKVISGAVQALFAGLVVLPAVWIASGFAAHIDWGHPLLLATVLPLGSLVGAALGLVLGTVVSPRRINFLFALLLVPLTLLGCVYYPWSALHAIPVLQTLVLVNPLVYVSEGLRAALSPQIPHMPLAAVYGLLGGALAVLLWIGLHFFQKRVQT
jgi:ABC-2 type transport system permease protein